MDEGVLDDELERSERLLLTFHFHLTSLLFDFLSPSSLLSLSLSLSLSFCVTEEEGKQNSIHSPKSSPS